MIVEKIHEERKRVAAQMRERLLGYLVGALGLVAGLAWNDAITSLINYLFPIAKNTVAMKFAYALIITVVIVVGIMLVTAFLKQKEKEEEKG